MKVIVWITIATSRQTVGEKGNEKENKEEIVSLC